MLTKSQPLNKLPIEVAEEMKWMAWNAAWHTANIRAGYKSDAVHNEISFNKHSENVSKAVIDLALELSPNTIENIKWGAWNAAWYTANARAGYDKDAKNNLQKFEQYFQSIKNSNEVTQNLSENIKQMCFYAAWHTANTRKNYQEDAKADLYRFEDFYSKICGETTVVEIVFDVANKILRENPQPKVLAVQEIINQSDSEQSMTFEYAYQKGETSSWSHKLGLKVGVKTSLKTGFTCIVEGKIEVSFETSYEYAWSGSTQESQTYKYSFPVKIKPQSKVTAKAIVQEATMSVPYKITYEIGGVKRKIQGIWDGVAYSSVQYDISQSTSLKLEA